ncbi:MAG: hypothetical protein LBU42_02885 [Prevotellaceae bacterium]|jgi:hypothetical protein|nr:hypothetical protein [Prevotellaceae bacterium]
MISIFKDLMIIIPDGLRKAIHIASLRDACRAPPVVSTDILSLTGHFLFPIFILTIDNL